MNPWVLSYEGFDPASEGLREALCTLGNGRFATRGATPDGELRTPGTYAAGCYDRLDSTVAGRTVTNEDLVNLPDWLPLTFAAPGSDWFRPERADLLELVAVQGSVSVVLELPFPDAADLLSELTPRRSFQHGNSITQPPGHLVRVEFGDEEPVPAEDGVVLQLLHKGQWSADGELKPFRAWTVPRADVHLQEFAGVGWIINAPPNIKVDPTEIVHSCSQSFNDQARDDTRGRIVGFGIAGQAFAASTRHRPRLP